MKKNNTKDSLKVIFEDNHLIVVIKNSGDLAQGDHTGDYTLGDKIKSYIKEKYQKPGNVFLGVCHRLDRPVSGLMIFAKTSKALTRLNEQFKNQEVKKTYWALSRYQPKTHNQQLTHYLVKDSKKNKTTAHINKVLNGKKATLSYQIIQQDKFKHTLFEIYPKTGRPHQIRVQLASINCPILGDLKYGDINALTNASICLHAYQIQFTHPISKAIITLKTPPPTLWNNLI